MTRTGMNLTRLRRPLVEQNEAHPRLWVWAALLASAAAIGFLGGCSRPAPHAAVLAKVGNREITADDFEREVQRYTRNGQALPDKQALLDDLIARELRVQKAIALGLNKDPEVERGYQILLASKLEQLELMPKLEATQASAEEIKASYEQNRSGYTHRGKARLALVCIRKERKMTTEQLAKAEARIREAHELAVALPATAHGFGKVAAEFSEDQASRYQGGDVGWFDEGLAEYRWPTDVVQAGFALSRPGEISEVIQSNDGFYLVRKLDTRAASVTPLSQVQNSIQHRLVLEKRQQVEAAFRQELQAFASVQTFPEALRQAPYPRPVMAQARTDQPPAFPTATDSANAK